MRFAAFVLVSVGLFAAWWAWLRRCHECGRSEAVAYAGLLGGAQLVLTMLALGAVGLLRLPWLLAALLPVSTALLAVAFRSPAVSAPAPGGSLAASLRNPVNLALCLLLGIASAWMLAATWLLPPRAIDDLAYHLPPLYELVRTGRITLLPLELRLQFAMPLGGEFLFLWPLIFLHADTWIDGVQFVVALYGAAVLYALARALAVARAAAMFAALLFPLTPVVLAQSGSNYVDVIVAACHLVLLYAAVRFWQQGTLFHLLLAGLAGGFGLSVKYNMVVAVVAVQPLIIGRMVRDRAAFVLLREYLVYLAATSLMPAYWILRNWYLTGHPLFPYQFTLSGLHDLGTIPAHVVAGQGMRSLGTTLSHLIADPGPVLLYLFRDPGLGTLNGGLGAVFWSLGVLAMAWCLASAIRTAGAGDYLPLLFWSQALAILLAYFQQADLARISYNMRLVIVVVPLTLLAVASFLEELRTAIPAFATALATYCVAAALLAVVQMGGVLFPGFDFGTALLDRARGQQTTPQRYYRQAHGDLSSMVAALEPLDYLTLHSAGWNVYMAADWRMFAVAPVYGSEIQNRVWNFLAEPRPPPDALLFHTGFSGGSERLLYVRGRITPEEVAADPRYERLALAGPTELWVRRDRLAEPTVRARLLDYYERAYADDIAAITAQAARLPPADALITAAPEGNALRYLSLTGTLRMPVYLAPPGTEAALARRLGSRQVLTLAAPLPGNEPERVARWEMPAGPLNVYRNTVLDAADIDPRRAAP
jgi:hypothetical protein